MDRSAMITLIGITQTQDSNGIWQETYTRRDVDCQVDSVTQSEFFEGGRNGLNPEYRFTLFYGAYQGERLVEYQGLTYAVYRTYFDRTDNIELYVERQGGANGKR